MKNEKSVFQNILAFAEDKGFYIILGLCVLAISVSGYVLFFTGNDTGGDIPPVIDDTISDDTQIAQPPQITPEPTPEPDTEVSPEPPEQVEPPEPPRPISDPIEVSEQPEDEAVETANPVSVGEVIFALPVGGDIEREFSGDELVFDPTMGDWRTHNGTDFLTAQDEPILAMASGEISAIFTDPMKGHCVSVQHGDGYISTYCGLAQNNSLTVGMKVDSGQPIGQAGGSMLSENAQQQHVHVELTHDGVHIDPMSVIPG